MENREIGKGTENAKKQENSKFPLVNAIRKFLDEQDKAEELRKADIKKASTFLSEITTMMNGRGMNRAKIEFENRSALMVERLGNGTDSKFSLWDPDDGKAETGNRIDITSLVNSEDILELSERTKIISITT